MSAEKNTKQVFTAALYECARCGTRVTGAELSKLPSPTCANCGYRVFKKIRSDAPKSIKSD